MSLNAKCTFYKFQLYMYASHKSMLEKDKCVYTFKRQIHAMQLSIIAELQKQAENFDYCEIFKSHHLNLCSM